METNQPIDYKIHPMPGRVVVELFDREERVGTIWIPQTAAHDRPILGRVIEICDTYELDGTEYEPLFTKGELVVFGKYSGTELQINRRKVLIIREKDILCKLLTPEQVSDHEVERSLKINERD